MNMRIINLLMIWMFISCANHKVVSQDDKSSTAIIKTKIYCDHCKECESCGGKLEKDLGFNKGIKLVKLDEKEMTITVTYNPKKTSLDDIRNSISMYGFDADSVKANLVSYGKLDECCKKPGNE
jgi:periplasmic mercuric ion binding protein